MRSRSSRGRERRREKVSRSGLVGAVSVASFVAGFRVSDEGNWLSGEGCV